jgi:hypothetical protein
VLVKGLLPHPDLPRSSAPSAGAAPTFRRSCSDS